MSQDDGSGIIGGSAATELAVDRTGLAFRRTLMGADRTLMAVIRTSLSLIGFGFTINQVFRQLSEKRLLPEVQTTGRHVGLALLVLGIVMLVMGIASHLRYFASLEQERRRLLRLGLLRETARYHATPTFLVAALLLALGVAAFLSAVFRILL